MQDSFGWKWWGYVCTAATCLSTILSRSSRPRFSSLKAGDFNSKSPEWGEARLDRRKILVGEVVARNDLVVLNRSRDFTFRRGAGRSIIDIMISAPHLA